MRHLALRQLLLPLWQVTATYEQGHRTRQLVLTDKRSLRRLAVIS